MTASSLFFIFFFNDTATTEIYTLSLHDALPICVNGRPNTSGNDGTITRFGWKAQNKSLELFSGEAYNVEQRSEEHTSELQSRLHLVCRLLLEKKKKKNSTQYTQDRSTRENRAST